MGPESFGKHCPLLLLYIRVGSVVEFCRKNELHLILNTISKALMSNGNYQFIFATVNLDHQKFKVMFCFGTYNEKKIFEYRHSSISAVSIFAIFKRVL